MKQRSSSVHVVGLVVGLVASACFGGCEPVAPTNPFDPATAPDAQAPGSLRGAIVLRDATLDGEVVGERAALAALTVSLRDGQGRLLQKDGAVVKRSLTGQDLAFAVDAARGAFVFDDLTPGSYSVVLEGVPAGYAQPGPVVAAIGPGQTTDLGTLELAYVVGDDGGPYVVQGVVDTAGPAAGPQTVSLFRSEGEGVVFVASTSAVGTFRFTGLFAGTYAVLVEGEGFMPAYRLDLPVSAAQPQTTFLNDDAITLHPVTAVLLPVTSGADAVINVEGENYVRGDAAPVAVLSFATDAAAELGVTRMRLATNPGFLDDAGAEIAFADYAASARVALDDREGRQTIYAQFEASSAAGFAFTSPTFSLDVVRDTVAPTVSATFPGLVLAGDVALSSSRTVALRATLHDATSAIAGIGVGQGAVPDAVEVVVASPGDVIADRTLSFDGDGEHDVFVVARDRARNDTAADPQVLRVLVDTVAPDVVLSIDNATGGVLAAPEAELRLVSRDPDDTALLVGFGVEGDFLTADTPITGVDGVLTATTTLRLPAGASPGGSLTFEAIAVDVVGNERRVTRTVNLPPAPTAPQLVIDGGAAATSDRTVRLRLAALNATRVCAVNLATEACFEAPAFDDELSFTLATTSGKAVVVATFFDAAGNSVSTSDSIVVDTEGPSLRRAVGMNGGAAFTTSVSATFTVDAEGADEMAIVEGDVDAIDPAALTFQPYAQQNVVLLSSTEDEKTVCVVLRDEAGNVLDPRDTADACATITLDATAPSSPIVVTKEEQVLKTNRADLRFRLRVAPLDDDVVAVRVSVEGPFNGQRLPPPRLVAIVDPGVSNDLIADVVGDVSTGVDGNEDTPHLFRLAARDRAGNESAQSTFLVVYDDRAPGVPTIADVDASSVDPSVLFPRQSGRDVRQVHAPKVNADAFAVRIVSLPNRIDRNFDRYEIARTVGKRVVAGTSVVRTPDDGLLPDGRPDPESPLHPDVVDLPYTASAGTDSLLVPLVQGAPLNGTSGDTIACTPRACLNHLFVRAVDAAGNVGPALRIDVVEDSGPPTRPTLSPRGGAMAGAEADIRLEVTSFDDSDFCDTDADCAGASCVKGACVVEEGGDGVPVQAYELKQGPDGAFGGVPPGQALEGPWRLALARNARNELCARGVDEAGNTGIEDCVVVDEASRETRLGAASIEEKAPLLAGDWLVYVVNDRLMLDDLASAAPTSAEEEREMVGMLAPRLSGSGAFGIDVDVAVVNGEDVLSVAATTTLNTTDIVQLRVGRPRLRPGEPAASALTDPSQQRNFRGFAPVLSGTTLTFACTESGTTRVMRADLQRLAQGGPPVTGVVAGAPSAASSSDFAACPPVDGTGRFVVLATLAAGHRVCATTAPATLQASTMWCDTNSPEGGVEQGTIIVVDGVNAPVTLAAAATSSHGALIDGGFGAPIGPLASFDRLVWIDAVTGTIHDRVVGGTPRDTGLVAGDLYSIDGSRLVYANVRADGLTDDLFNVDLRTNAPTAVALTDDLPPDSDGAIDQGRIAVTEQTSTGSDVALLRLGEDTWIESSATFRFLPATSSTRAAWAEVAGDSLVVLSEDIATGEQAVVLTGQELFDRLEFIGGSFLGASTLDVGADTVAVARPNDARTSWTASFFEVRGLATTFLFEVAGIAPAAAPGVREATLAWDLDVDGDAFAFVDDASNALVVQRISGAGRAPLLSVPSGRGLVDASQVPFVALDDDAATGLTAVVWQLGNVGSDGSSAFGDLRRDRQGAFVYAERRGGTVITASLRSQGGAPVVGRSPSIALSGGRVFLAWQTVTEVSLPSGGGFAMHRTRLCEVVVAGNVAVCTNERLLDDAGTTVGDSGAPVVSRRGFVAWPNGAGRLTPQIDRYDIARNVRVSLTAGRDDGLVRDVVAAAGDVVLWLDGRLGTTDVWFATVP